MYTLEEIEKYTNGTIINGDKKTILKRYSVNNKHKKGEFFIPIIFHEIDREKYVIDSVKAGGIGFIINKNSQRYEEIIQSAKKINPNICIIEVEGVNKALYQLGLESRKRNIDKPIIAVTGSVGKSTLSNLIAKILETEKKVLYDFNNQNNNTKWHISQTLMDFENYEMAVIELGISRIGVMTQLSKLVEPSITVINSIGTAHLNNFKTIETTLKEKLHITDYIKDKKILFINTDDAYLQKVEKTNLYDIRKYSLREAYDIKEYEGKPSFKTKIYGKETEFNLDLYGKHHISNIILAIKIGEIYNISYENIVKAINSFKAIDGRFKVIKNNQKNITIIDDAYNSSLIAAKFGLEIANKIESKRKIAVLGKLGEESHKMNEELGKFFENLEFDYLFTTGEYAENLIKGAEKFLKKENIKCFKEKNSLMSELDKTVEEGDLIYIKAANSEHFNEIVKYFKEKYGIL